MVVECKTKKMYLIFFLKAKGAERREKKKNRFTWLGWLSKLRDMMKWLKQ